jgi:DNA-binding XRE family transcriptional regulator
VNPIEKVDRGVRKRLPKADTELLSPRDPDGRWVLDVEHDGWLAVVVWVPRRGFGMTVRPMDDPSAYGEGPDVAYPADAEQLVDSVVTHLRGKRRTSPPRSVALRELRARCGATQAEVAARLSVKQGTVSKLERRERLDVGTLSELVAAMGGELELWVRFPDDAPVRLSPPTSPTLQTSSKRGRGARTRA